MNHSARIIFVLTFFLSALNPELSPAERFDDIDITVLTHSEKDSCHGYFEHRMTVFNHSQSASHRVTIELPIDSRSGRGNHIRSIRRTVSVAPRTKANVSIFQPSLPVRGKSGKVSVDGVTFAQFLDIKRIPHAGYNCKKPVVLVSHSLNRDNLSSQLINLFGRSKVKKKIGGSKLKKKKRKKPEEILVRAEHDIQLWSAHWLGYSRYDGIMMQGADWTAAPEPVKAALASYIKAGGTLTLLGDFESASFPGVVYTKSQHNMNIYAAGFGRLTAIPTDEINGINDAQLNYLKEEWRITQLPFINIPDEAAANKAFPIIDGFDFNLKSFLLIMLIFVILAGPLNLFILHRLKKKIWLVWTFPLIALITAASVFGFVLFSEGLDADAKISGITLLDQTKHEAVTLGMAAFYCRMTPADGLRFSTQTELTPLVSRRYYRGGAARTIDLTADQHFTSGWITARVPAHFMIRKIEKRRERLQVTWRNDGRPIVVNGLGAPIDQLYLADDQGQVYSGNQIPVGASVVLDNASAHVRLSTALKKNLRQTYVTFAKQKQFEQLFIKEQQDVAANMYIALTDGCPFIEKGLADPDNLESNAIVMGIFASSDTNARN